MPFCPKCRYEYLPTVEICPDCDVKLVPTLPLEPEEPEESEEPPDFEEPDVPSEPEMLESFDNWIPLARIVSPVTSEMLLEALHSKDIPAILSDHTGYFGKTGQMGVSSYPPIEGAVVTLFVPEEFVRDADQEARIVLGDEWEKVRLIKPAD
jgi:hypothetical protein